ncbi:MAG TPA: hypothetical protein PLX97_01875 [Gemmatales bacterium]|nr:hypothetical protein [Gemmatales bacterium]
MSKLHYMAPTAPAKTPFTARLGATGSANNYSTLDEGKPVKLAAESQYNLSTAVGDEIEGFIFGVDTATSGGFSVGSIVEDGIVLVTFDGAQGTGTGAVSIGDYVVTGTTVAKGTALTEYPRVRTATAAGNTLNYKWRVVSRGTAGTGAVGTTGAIKRVI